MLYSYGVDLPRAEVVAGQSLEVRQEISAVASPVKDIVVPLVNHTIRSYFIGY